MRSRTGLTGAALVVGLVLGCALALGRRSPLGENFHAVIPGEVYRSAQLDAETLRERARELSLRSVLAARPVRRGSGWYPEERRVVEELGMRFASVPLSAQKMPTPASLLALVEAIDTAPRPILLHCRAGVDRSGLAAAVSLLLDGVPPHRARDQYSWRYGFHPWLSWGPLPRVLDRYESWLLGDGAEHTPALFRSWVEHSYVPAFYAAEIAIAGLPPALPRGAQATLRVQVTNRSPEPIPFGAEVGHGVHVGTWIDRLGDESGWRAEGRLPGRTTALAPGERFDFEAAITVPDTPGRYRLRVDLVDEHVTWFEEMGSPPGAVEFEVEARLATSG